MLRMYSTQKSWSQGKDTDAENFSGLWPYKDGVVVKAATQEHFRKQAQALKISTTPLKLQDLFFLCMLRFSLVIRVAACFRRDCCDC